MYEHIKLGNTAFARKRLLFSMISAGLIGLGGNKKEKIYGTLTCRSGEKMKTINRVFFSSEAEAREEGYRPCANCMRQEYKLWKKSQ